VLRGKVVACRQKQDWRQCEPNSRSTSGRTDFVGHDQPHGARLGAQARAVTDIAQHAWAQANQVIG
jgi:hypothetical protein